MSWAAGLDNPWKKGRKVRFRNPLSTLSSLTTRERGKMVSYQQHILSFNDQRPYVRTEHKRLPKAVLRDSHKSWLLSGSKHNLLDLLCTWKEENDSLLSIRLGRCTKISDLGHRTELVNESNWWDCSRSRESLCTGAINRQSLFCGCQNAGFILGIKSLHCQRQAGWLLASHYSTPSFQFDLFVSLSCQKGKQSKSYKAICTL